MHHLNTISRVLILKISKCNKGNRFSLCVIDLFSKYEWVVPLKDKEGIIK